MARRSLAAPTGPFGASREGGRDQRRGGGRRLGGGVVGIGVGIGVMLLLALLVLALLLLLWGRRRRVRQRIAPPYRVRPYRVCIRIPRRLVGREAEEVRRVPRQQTPVTLRDHGGGKRRRPGSDERGGARTQ